MKKSVLSLFFITVLSVASVSLSGQAGNLRPGEGNDTLSSYRFRAYLGITHLSLNYSISPSFSTGLYFGSHGFLIPDYGPDMSAGRHYDLFYGVTGSVHLLPLLFDNTRSRFDIYLKGKLGAFSYRDYDMDNYSSTMDYGVYMGAAWYIFKPVGVFVEAGYGKSNWSQVGLVWRF